MRDIRTNRAKGIEGGIRNAEVGSEGRRNVETLEVGIYEGVNGYDGLQESGFTELKRIEVPSLPRSERQSGFDEVALCCSDEKVNSKPIDVCNVI